MRWKDHLLVFEDVDLAAVGEASAPIGHAAKVGGVGTKTAIDGALDSGWAVAPTGWAAPPEPSDPIVVNNATAGRQVGAGSVIQLADGQLVYAWTGPNDGLQARIFGTDGDAGSGDLQVSSNTVASLPHMAALADGGFVIGWSSVTYGENADGETVATSYVRARLFDADGQPRGGEIRLNLSVEGLQTAVRLEALPNGGFVASWSDEDYSVITGAVFGADGSLTQRFSVPAKVDFTVPHSNLTVLENGGFVLTWQNAADQDASFQLFSPTGAPVGGPAAANTVRVASQTQSDVTALDGGGFLVHWVDYAPGFGGSDILGQVYDGQGRKVGGNIILAPPDGAQNSQAIVAIEGGGFAVAWRQSPGGSAPYSVQLRTFDATGAAEGVLTLASGLASRPEPKVAALVGGGLVVVWEGAGGLVGQRIAADGGPDGAVFSISAGAGDIEAFSILALDDGGFVVTWDQDRNGFDDVHTRIYRGEAGDGEGPTDGDDRLTGSTGRDEIDGLGGDDVIEGLGGDDVLIGGDGHDRLDGGTGADRLVGGAGDDTYVVDSSGDRVMEANGQGDDLILSSVDWSLAGHYVERLTLTGTARAATGNSLANTLTGNASNNILDGGAGADVMIGGAGHDRYIVDNTKDRVIEKNREGDDLVVSSVSYALAGTYVERLELTGSANLNATGNSLDNRLTGNAGANVLAGGKGDDTFIVQTRGDRVIEAAGEGDDHVLSSVDFSMGGQAIERLTLTGTAKYGTGNDLDNAMTGNAANNVLDGGKGADVMTGGKGHDRYVVDNTKDRVIEKAGEGSDLVVSSVSYSLAGTYVERLELTGSAALNATGNSLDNVLTGNGGANRLEGGGGADTLIGGLGQDTYVYRAVSESTVAKSDTIVELGFGDRLDLSLIDANSLLAGDQAFALTDAFSGGRGQATLTYDAQAKMTTLLLDLDGDRVADMRILIGGDANEARMIW